MVSAVTATPQQVVADALWEVYEQQSDERRKQLDVLIERVRVYDVALCLELDSAIGELVVNVADDAATIGYGIARSSAL